MAPPRKPYMHILYRPLSAQTPLRMQSFQATSSVPNRHGFSGGSDHGVSVENYDGDVSHSDEDDSEWYGEDQYDDLIPSTRSDRKRKNGARKRMNARDGRDYRKHRRSARIARAQEAHFAKHFRKLQEAGFCKGVIVVHQTSPKEQRRRGMLKTLLFQMIGTVPGQKDGPRKRRGTWSAVHCWLIVRKALVRKQTAFICERNRNKHFTSRCTAFDTCYHQKHVPAYCPRTWISAKGEWKVRISRWRRLAHCSARR